MQSDHIDGILDQWRRERPDLDPSPIGVVGRVSRAARRLEQGIGEVMAAEGLNGGTFDVLAALRRSGPPYRLSPGRLLGELLLSSGAMTNRIDRLEAAGLVGRSPDPDDRRGVLVGLTDSGLETVNRVVPRHLANETRLLEGLTGQEQEALAGLLRKLLRSLRDADPLPADAP